MLKFGCSILDNNCDFKHSRLQNTRYVTYQELFIFWICLEIVSGTVKGIYSWPIFQFIKAKLSWDDTLASLTKGIRHPPYVYKIRKHLFQFYQLVFVWDTFSWNDPLENNVYKHPRTYSTLLTQAYHQCTSQQVLSTSPWPVTAFTKALCSLAI